MFHAPVHSYYIEAKEKTKESTQKKKSARKKYGKTVAVKKKVRKSKRGKRCAS